MMVRLSPRLAAIGKEIQRGETMADIGCDHGFLPVSLWERKICPHVIMSDISAGSLAKAEENCRRFYPGVRFDLRLGGGLDVLQPAEVDVVVMAGIGGMLMTEILGEDEEKSHSFHRFVLQPRNHIGRLRHWLYHHGFSIAREGLVREGKFICEILTVLPKEMATIRSLEADRIEYQYPRRLLEFHNELTAEYIQMKLRLEEEILDSMHRAKTPDWRLLRSQTYRVDYLRDLLEDCRRLT